MHARSQIVFGTVTAYEPGRSITIASVESTFPIEVTRSVEALGERRTRVTADVSGGPGGVGKLFEPLTRRLVAGSVDGDYARLERLLEGGG